MCARLVDFLKEQNWSLDEFAQKLGGNADHSIISRYLSGERFPSFKRMLRIAEVTNGQVMPNDWIAGFKAKRANAPADDQQGSEPAGRAA